MTDKTCATCTSWTPPDFEASHCWSCHPPKGTEFEPDPPELCDDLPTCRGLGTCGGVVHKSKESSKVAEVEDLSGCNAWLRTAPTFGCLLHEAKA